jgi:hypothetical protein
MKTWFLERLFWFGARILVTLACCVTVQNIIAEEGYRCELKSIVLAAACVIVAVRFWMPKQQPSSLNFTNTDT